MATDTTARPTAFDKQGDLPDTERTENAMQGFVRDFGATAAIYMESCIACGLCAEACHFYIMTGDEKYTPIHKIAPFKQAYLREYSPFAPLYRWLGLTRTPDIRELEEWEELVYDSCTMCGRCTMICPMGIDIAELVKEARHGMYKAGLVPNRLATITRNAESRHSPFGTEEQFLEKMQEIAEGEGRDFPVNRERADYLVTLAPGELESHWRSITAIADILDHLGIDWTLHSKAFEATNFGFLSGNMPLQKELTTRLVDVCVEIGAKRLILPECGHAYGAARWEAAMWYGEPVPVEVVHMTEYLAELVREGKIRLRPIEDTATFHDPCQLVRRGGVSEEPREILAALGLDVTEMQDNREFGFCCGGGGGVLANERAQPLRDKVFELKRHQVEETGANRFVTSCGQCRMTFDKGAERHHWEKRPESLLELVHQQMITEGA